MMCKRRRLARMLICAVCALAAIPGSAVAQPPQPVATGTLTGTIVARETGQAVANVSVTVEGADLTAFTNDVGRFRLDRVPVGAVVLFFRSPGFLELRVAGIQIRARETTTLGVDMQVTPQFLERLQVTATKTPLSIADVAAQASIVDRDAIERRGDQTLTQAIANTPGAVVSTQLGLFESVMLRGMPRGDPEFTNTLLLIDGVPQTLSNNGARVTALTLNDASAIEVVRGPNSALYGRTAIGGAVNLRTADPTPNHEAGLDLTGGELGMAKGVARASGPFLKWGGYYVSIAKEREGGYFQSKTTDDFVTGNKALFAKITFTIDPRSYGSITVNRVVSENSTPTNEPVIDGQLLHTIEPAFNRFTNFNIPGRNYRQSEGRLTLNYTRQFTSRVKASGVFGFRAVKHHFVEDGDFIAGPFDLAAHTATMYPFTQETDEDIFYSELRVELTPKLSARKDALVLGASHEANKGALASDFIFTDPETEGWPINYLNPVIPPASEWVHSTSSRTYNLGVTGLFAQYMIEATPRTIVTAAGRFDRLGLTNTRSSVTTSNTFTAFSPKLSATYKLLGAAGANAQQPSLNVYGAYSHAFLPPRRPSSLVPDDASLDLKPEDINNYEGGLKASLLEGRLALEATYFFMTEDGVVLTTREGPFFRPTNSGQQRYKGVEAGAHAMLSPELSFFANASFYRNRFGAFVVESEDGPEGDEVLTGNRLPISPDYVMNVGASFSPMPHIDATVEVKRVGDVQTNRENTFRLDAHTLVDAAVSWRRGLVRVTVSAHNLLNEAYYSNSDGETADPGRPRQLLVTTSLRVR